MNYVESGIALFKSAMMNYLKFDGVMSRKDFILLNIAIFVATFIMSVVVGMSGLLGLIVVVQLVFFIPVVSSQIKRCRDIGITPWVCLLHLLVIGVFPLGSIILTVAGATVPQDYMKKNEV